MLGVKKQVKPHEASPAATGARGRGIPLESALTDGCVTRCGGPKGQQSPPHTLKE